ncbi:fibronectin type III domain-containing protein [Pseudomonas sp. H11T01]|uniref:fibronectin type III domain-containing protein n=1 Tax=Pseudomonas sp. H11T01 TaxID=3402749 RepID=UPI003ACCDC8A
MSSDEEAPSQAISHASAQALTPPSLPARITQKTQDGPPIPSRPGPLHTLVNYDTVRVFWPAPQSPQYEITYGLEDKFPDVIGRETTKHLNFLVKYLAPDSRYFIEVRAFNVSGYSAPSQATIKTGPDMTQPRNLRNPGRTFSETWLTWDKPDDASYLIDYEITCPGREPVRTTALEHIATGLTPEKGYLFKVQPRRPEGPVPALPASISVVTHDQVPPTRPQALKLTFLTPGNAMLNWRASQDNVGVTGYLVRRDGGAAIPVEGTSFAVTLMPEGLSDFEVRARDAAGNLSLAARWKDVMPPSKPTDLRAFYVTHNFAILDWTAATDNVAVISHQIYRDDELIHTIDSPDRYLRYLAQGLTSSTDYTFKIRALDAAGNFRDSDPLSLRTPGSDTTPPSTPGNFRASAITSSSAVLEWARSEDNVAVSGYQVYRPGTPFDTVGDPRYNATGLSGSTTYRFEVLAVDTAGNRSEPAVVEVTTLASNAPTSLVFNRLSNRVGTIQWAPPIESGGVTGYQLSRDGRFIREFSELHFMFNDLTAGTTYLFEVRAIRDGKYSDPASIRG